MSDAISSLPDLLATEAGLMESFVTLLHQEQDAIKSGDTQAMEHITPDKMALVDRLNRQGESRNHFLTACGLQHDRAGIDAWLASNPKEIRVASMWGKLKELVMEARELNLLNGKLIAMRLQHNQQALSALLSTSSPQSNLYGPNGQPTQLSGRRIIDAA